MREINLLPSHIAERRRAREITMLIGAGGLAVLALLVVVFLVQAARLSGERGRLDDAKRRNDSLRSRVAQLEAFAQRQQTLQTKRGLLTSLTQNEVRWSVILNDVSMAIPSDVWLTSFTGSLQQTAAPQVGTSALPIGTLSFSGMTFTHLDVAKWLARLGDVPEFSFPYLTLSAKSGAGTSALVNFNSTANLSDAALRRNQPGGERNIS